MCIFGPLSSNIKHSISFPISKSHFYKNSERYFVSIFFFVFVFRTISFRVYFLRVYLTSVIPPHHPCSVFNTGTFWQIKIYVRQGGVSAAGPWPPVPACFAVRAQCIVHCLPQHNVKKYCYIDTRNPVTSLLSITAYRI